MAAILAMRPPGPSFPDITNLALGDRAEAALKLWAGLRFSRELIREGQFCTARAQMALTGRIVFAATGALAATGRTALASLDRALCDGERHLADEVA